MAKEIEAKFAVKGDIKEFIQKLTEKGIRQRWKRTEVNVFFDSNRKKLDKQGETLRIRTEIYHFQQGVDVPDGISLTFKGKKAKGKLKTRDEHEIQVSSFDQARLIVESLGYKEHFRFEKRRESFYFGDCIVEIDELPHLGFFCEVEGGSEVSVRNALKKLGLDKMKLTTSGYGELLWKDAVKNKRSKKKVMFADEQPKADNRA